MYNDLYDVTVLSDNIQERLIKNYEIEANRAMIGNTSGNCFWTRQVLAEIIMEGLPFAKYVNSELYDSLYNIYLKISTE